MTSISERYSSAAARFSAVIAAVPGYAWEHPSPCEGWKGGDILDHVVSTELDFLGQRQIEVPETSAMSKLDAWPLVRDTVQSVLDDPDRAGASFDGFFGPTTVEQTIDRFYTLDLLVHRWDLATTAGLSELATLDSGEIDVIRGRVAGFPEEVMRSPGLFGPAIEPAADADETTRLMNFLGRSA